MSDPWAHRTQGMKCGSCIWFMEKVMPEVIIQQLKTVGDAGAAVGLAIDPRGSLGRCRRHCPTMNGFPAVFTKDWCGDHKLDENKI